ncbi:MAG: alpha/beta fold hydrolase [Bradymonadia bacterium]
MTPIELDLPALSLESGPAVDPHHVSGFAWGREDGPAVLVIHALTGNAQAALEGGWWFPMIGEGSPIDTHQYRVLCFNNLGSCYGTSGPGVQGFPMIDGLPAAVTPWDMARSIAMALDALGVSQLHLVTGGSLGAMVTLCLARMLGTRVERIAPIAGCEAASPWIIGFNHVARQLILDATDRQRGLELARQLAMLTYRAEPGLTQRHGRRQRHSAGHDARSWRADLPYQVQSYLDHQGRKLAQRFAPEAYLCQLGAMDHHDLERQGGAITASTLAVGIDSDQLFFPVHMRRLVERLRLRVPVAEYAEISSLHGHDGFLIEWDQLGPILRQALALELE